MKNKTQLKIFICLFSLLFLLAPFFSQAKPNLNYEPMENIPGFEQKSKTGDFYDYIQAVYKFGIWAVGISALLMITIGGFMYITSAGNNSSMEKAKSVITDAIIGLVLALTSYLILYVINPDLVNIQKLKPVGTTSTTDGAGGTTGGTTSDTGGSITGGDDCTNIASNKNNICEGTVCSKQRCNNLTAYESLINENRGSIPANIIKSLICRESDGVPNAKHNNSFGLMQVDLSSTDYTEQELYKPEINIKEGIRILNEKITAVSTKNYPPVTSYEMAFAAYNCCIRGNPNDTSEDCNSSNGWEAIPKWACPISPGTGVFNMCKVKDYACQVEACASQY